MQVKMGNESPHAHILPGEHDGSPCEYIWIVPDEAGYTHVAEGRMTGAVAMLHVLRSQGGAILHLPDHEAFVSVVTDFQAHSSIGTPTWVWSDNEDLAKMLSEAYDDCPIGRPDDVENTHHTDAGPPGVGPSTEG